MGYRRNRRPRLSRPARLCSDIVHSLQMPKDSMPVITTSIRASLFSLYIVSASLAVIGCQTQHDSPSNVGSPISRPEQAPAQTETPTLAPHQALPPLVCANPENCPAAVGELMSYSDMQLGFCTVSLVAPDIVLTASHCVPWKAVGLDHKIRGNCWIRFPELAGRGKGEAVSAESVACNEVIDATTLTPSNGRHLQADFAYLRLARPLSREPLRIASREENSGKPHASLLYGIRLGTERHDIDLLSCARDDAFDLGQLSAPKGQSLVMPSCGVRPGFSGGPILDPLTHKLVAVISGVVGYDAAHPDVPKPSIGTRISREERMPSPVRQQVQLK
jgi:hypothetical protein